MFNYKKSRKVLVLTAAVSLLCSQSVFAETLELDLDDAVQRALTTNPAIKIAVSERKVPERNLMQHVPDVVSVLMQNIDLDVVDMQIHSGIQLLEVIAKILVILTVILLPLRFPFILVDNYQER